MDGSGRSVNLSGSVVKTRNASGCLIIRKKGDGMGGVGTSGSGNVSELRKEKKRLRLVASHSESSDESLEPSSHKVYSRASRMCNGFAFGRSSVKDTEIARKMNESERINFREGAEYGRNEGESRVIGSRLDVYEFNEYDGTDAKKMRKEHWGGSNFEARGRISLGSNRHSMLEKTEEPPLASSSSYLHEKKRRIDHSDSNRLEMIRNRAPPADLTAREKLRFPTDTSIRLQGKNGVLKVMLKKKKLSGSPLADHHDSEENRQSAKSADTVRRLRTNIPKHPSLPPEAKLHNKKDTFIRKEKENLDLPKSLPIKNSKGRNREAQDSDSALKVASKSFRKRESEGDCRTPSSEKRCDRKAQDSDSALKLKMASKRFRKEVKDRDYRTPSSEKVPPSKLKEVKSPSSGKVPPSKLKDGKPSLSGKVPPSKLKDIKSPSSENVLPSKCSEGKVKRGSGTEKQILREQIRGMLVSAGWTIDYRPRRNRDYLDAVYINPSGTAYWSIIKAYDAFQKQHGDEDNSYQFAGSPSSFTPISEDVLSKLTRQTRKKIEKEMKRKRDEGGTQHDENYVGSNRQDDKLSSFIKQRGKSLRGRVNENGYLSPMTKGYVKSKSSIPRSNETDTDKPHTTSNSNFQQGRKGRKLGRCTLLIRGSKEGTDLETDGYVPYTGKRTILSWLIDSGIVKLSEKVQYMKRKHVKVMLEGWITRDGIHCGCCSKILTVSKFEIHAGSKVCQPFQNIYLESGVSLLQCQMDAWNKQPETERRGFNVVDIDGEDPNDDTCGICGDGGDLICCDGCPSTYHQSCLDIQMLPPGDWHCFNCSCKYCGLAGGSFALLTCLLCEKKYHQSCVKGTKFPADSDNISTAFCGQTCQELYESLQKYLGVKHELEAGFSWSLIHRTDADSDSSIKGYPQRVESNSKLAVALTVMDECFLPIIDRRSGINLIQNVLYNCGSNFNRLNYTGFYTAILERGDEIVSAASIRIHGTQLAEMPFIGTRHIYRRQGMCRRLFHAIESALCSLKVEKLIIPAIAEHMHTWTLVFGFQPLDNSLKKDMRSINMLVFPDTDMLQKKILKQEYKEEERTNIELHHHLNSKEDTDKSEIKSSVVHEDHPNEENGKVSITDESEGNETTVETKSVSPSGTGHGVLEMTTEATSSPLTGVEPKLHSYSNNQSEDKLDDATTQGVDEMQNKLLLDSLADISAQNNAEETTVIHNANVRAVIDQNVVDKGSENFLPSAVASGIDAHNLETESVLV